MEYPLGEDGPRQVGRETKVRGQGMQPGAQELRLSLAPSGTCNLEHRQMAVRLFGQDQKCHKSVIEGNASVESLRQKAKPSCSWKWPRPLMESFEKCLLGISRVPRPARGTVGAKSKKTLPLLSRHYCFWTEKLSNNKPEECHKCSREVESTSQERNKLLPGKNLCFRLFLLLSLTEC